MFSAAPRPGASLIDQRKIAGYWSWSQLYSSLGELGTRLHIWCPRHCLASPHKPLLPVGMMGPKSGLSCGAFVPTVPSP